MSISGEKLKAEGKQNDFNKPSLNNYVCVRDYSALIDFRLTFCDK